MKDSQTVSLLDEIDNTNGHELTVFAVELLREVNGEEINDCTSSQ